MRGILSLLAALGGCLALLWITSVFLLTRQSSLLLLLMAGVALLIGSLAFYARRRMRQRGERQQSRLTLLSLGLLTLCGLGVGLTLGILTMAIFLEIQ